MSYLALIVLSRMETYQSKRLDSQRPRPHEVTDNSSSKYRFDLGNSAVPGINCKSSYQEAGA